MREGVRGAVVTADQLLTLPWFCWTSSVCCCTYVDCMCFREAEDCSKQVGQHPRCGAGKAQTVKMCVAASCANTRNGKLCRHFSPLDTCLHLGLWCRAPPCYAAALRTATLCPEQGCPPLNGVLKHCSRAPSPSQHTNRINWIPTAMQQPTHAAALRGPIPCLVQGSQPSACWLRRLPRR